MGAPVIAVMSVLLAGLAGACPATAALDPTAPPKLPASSAAGAPEPAALAWVRVNGKRSLAWFGGMPVQLGDSVEGGRVVAIREDHIVIAGREGRRAVYLLDPAVRPRQSNNQR